MDDDCIYCQSTLCECDKDALRQEFKEHYKYLLSQIQELKILVENDRQSHRPCAESIEQRVPYA